MNIQYRLRETCQKLRRTPMPIADVIPLLQEAAATIDAMQIILIEKGLVPPFNVLKENESNLA